ncbi:hypothetical protein PENTCL1PPCAC_22317, partial [Pristionchus entomophagus]
NQSLAELSFLNNTLNPMDCQRESGENSAGIWNDGERNEAGEDNRADRPSYQPSFDTYIEKSIELDARSRTSQHFQDLLACKSKMLAGVLSVGSIKFDIELERVKVDREDHKDLLVNIVCHREGFDPHWRCSFYCEIEANIGNLNAKTHGQKADARYKDNSLCMPVMRLPNGEIVEASLLVKIKIHKWTGINPRLLHDFTKENQYTNATLIVENQPLYVTREILSIHSSFFNILFNDGNFVDASKTEYELPDVSYSDMILFLNLTYPETMVGKREDFVTSIVDLDRLLHLSEQYSVPSFKTLAERLLMNAATTFPGVDWTRILYIADRFRLSEACSTQMKRLQTERDFIRLRNSEEFDELSARLRSSLLKDALGMLTPSTSHRKTRIPSRTGRIGAFSDVEADDDEDFSDVEILGIRVGGASGAPQPLPVPPRLIIRPVANNRLAAVSSSSQAVSSPSAAPPTAGFSSQLASSFLHATSTARAAHVTATKVQSTDASSSSLAAPAAASSSAAAARAASVRRIVHQVPVHGLLRNPKPIPLHQSNPGPSRPRDPRIERTVTSKNTTKKTVIEIKEEVESESEVDEDQPGPSTRRVTKRSAASSSRVTTRSRSERNKKKKKQ